MGWKVVPTTARFAKQRVTLPTINVKEAGYLFTYLSYEDQSNNYVYFDDYKVTYTPTNIVQYNEYYPYGLVTNNSWTKENAVGNNFLGNGGTELNTTTSLYDLEYRNYDPALARMHQVDPMADKYASYTPYNYSFNAPSNFNDVNGADPSPGEKDHVTRRGNQILRMGITGGNDFSRIFRGGSQYGMFNAGWSPSSNSMTQVGGMTGEQYSQMHEDARAVNNKTMSPQEYGFKYGEKNYWVSYRENENSDGSISGGFYLYHDRTFWQDEPNDFSSTRIPLAFAVYKNGAGSEYWGGKASNEGQSDAAVFFNFLDKFGDLGLTTASVTWGSGQLLYQSVNARKLAYNLSRATGFRAGQLYQAAKGTGNVLSKVGKVAGAFGTGITVGVAVYEFSTGNDNAHTWMDIGVTGLGIGAGLLFGAAAAPAILVGGVAYGIFTLSGGKEWIDDQFGYIKNK
jgi:RHS repeat-associated protein